MAEGIITLGIGSSPGSLLWFMTAGLGAASGGSGVITTLLDIQVRRMPAKSHLHEEAWRDD